MAVALVIAGSIFFGALLVLALANVRWQTGTKALLRQLTAAGSSAPGAVALETVAVLPPPVQRYLRTVLREGQPRVQAVRLSQTGQFNRGTGDDGWRPFTATQVVATTRPGFVWEARIRMAPLLTVRVRDAYVAGRPIMRGAILGAIPLVNAPESRELAEGELLRYLAETPWYPTVLRPGNGVTWSPMDDTHALATLRDGDLAVSLEFEFSPTGEVAGVYTPRRCRDENGQYIARPWGGRFRRYEERSGTRVPLQAEVYWRIDQRDQLYWRGELTSIEVGFCS
jgi:hypothetical protein